MDYRITDSKRRYRGGHCPTCAEEGCNKKTCILTPYCSKHTEKHYGVALRKTAMALAGHKTRTTGLFYVNNTVLPKGTFLTLPYSGTLYDKPASRKKGVRQDPEITKIARRIKYVAYDFKGEKYVNSTDVRNYPGRFIRVAGKGETPNVALDASRGFASNGKRKHKIIQGNRYRLKTLKNIKTDDELLMRPFTRAQLLSIGLYSKQIKTRRALEKGVSKGLAKLSGDERKRIKENAKRRNAKLRQARRNTKLRQAGLLNAKLRQARLKRAQESKTKKKPTAATKKTNLGTTLRQNVKKGLDGDTLKRLRENAKRRTAKLRQARRNTKLRQAGLLNAKLNQVKRTQEIKKRLKSKIKSRS